MESKRKSQKQQVKNHLLLNGSLDITEAIDRYFITRLASYICQLRNEGWEIETDLSKGYANYISKETYDNLV